MKRFNIIQALFFIVIVLPLNSFSTTPLPGQIVGTYGTADLYGNELPYCLVNSPGGGYLICGEAFPGGDGGNSNILLTRIDSTGQLIWSTQLGGSSSEFAYGMTKASDGSYLIAGCSLSIYPLMWTSWLLKIDDSGNVVWQKAYGNDGVNRDEILRQVAPSMDGNFISVGGVLDTESQGLIIKFDTDGNLIWKKKVRTSSVRFDNLKILEDGGFLTWGADWQTDVSWLFRFDPDGNLLWAKEFDESLGGLYDVSKALNGDYLLAMHHVDYVDHGYPVMIRLAPDGNVVWAKKLVVPYDKWDYDNNVWVHQIFPKGDGNFIAFSEFSAYIYNDEYYGGNGIIQFNEDGTMGGIVLINYGPFGTNQYSSHGAVIAPDGNLAYCAGAFYTYSIDYCLVKTGEGNKIEGNCAANIEVPLLWEDYWAPAPSARTIQVGSMNLTCADTSSLNLISQPATRGLNTFCPVIYTVNKLQNPFRLEILGDNLYGPGGYYSPQVLIDAVPVPQTTVKSPTRMVAKKDSALKIMIPKGVPVCVQIRAVDSAGGEYPLYKSDCFTFTR